MKDKVVTAFYKAALLPLMLVFDSGVIHPDMKYGLVQILDLTCFWVIALAYHAWPEKLS